MMMYNKMMENFLPSIIDKLLWLHRDMRGNMDTKEFFMRLERRSLRSRL
jgi:hypothetical protein